MRKHRWPCRLSVIPGTRRGFTLIELMLVVAIIGLLAAIAIPKFANLVIKAKEAAIRGKMGTMRSAISIYYADNEGYYPAYQNLHQILTTGGRYLDKLPFFAIPTQPVKHFERTDSNGVVNSVYDWNSAAGWEGWSYIDFPNRTGQLIVNCTHTDSKGTTWSLY